MVEGAMRKFDIGALRTTGQKLLICRLKACRPACLLGLLMGVGLRDTIIVQTDDAVLVADKGQAQKIKELVKKLAADAKLKKLV